MAIQQLLLASKGALDPYSGNVSALLHLNGSDTSTTITDETGKTWSFGGNGQLDTDQAKFGTSSALLDGSGDYFDVAASSAFTFGTGDFTVEAYFRPSSVTGLAILFDSRPFGTQGNYPCVYRDGTTLYFFVNSANVITASSALTNNTWQHVALSRVSGSTKLFVEGTQVGSTYSDSNNYINNFFIFGASSNGGGTLGYAGHIDEVRITKGVGRYSSNFTPPTTEFPYP